MNLITNDLFLSVCSVISSNIRALSYWGYYHLSDSCYCITAHDTSEYVQIVCEQERTSIIVCILEKNQFFCVEFSDKDVPAVKPYTCHLGILDLTEDGRRWEGMVYNEVPYGLGTLYDSEGKREYYGFLMEDTKVCYGTDYYSDIERRLYEGPFCSGVRCGKGTLWDRQGSVIHSGFFAGDPVIDQEPSPFFLLDIECIRTLEDSYSDMPKELFLSTWFTELTSITIGNHSFCGTTRFVIEYLPRLESIEIGEDCFGNVRSGTLRIRGCTRLRSFVCGSYCFAHYYSCEITQCPLLAVLDIADYCFECVETFSLQRTYRFVPSLKILRG